MKLSKQHITFEIALFLRSSGISFHLAHRREKTREHRLDIAILDGEIVIGAIEVLPISTSEFFANREIYKKLKRRFDELDVPLKICCGLAKEEALAFCQSLKVCSAKRIVLPSGEYPTIGIDEYDISSRLPKGISPKLRDRLLVLAGFSLYLQKLDGKSRPYITNDMIRQWIDHPDEVLDF